MGDVISFPATRGGRPHLRLCATDAPPPANRGGASGGGILVAPGPGATSIDGSAAGDYTALLDDMLARHRALAGGLPRWGDTAAQWLDDAKTLMAEIGRRPVGVRMAVPVATLMIELRTLADAMAAERREDIGECDFGLGCLAEAAAINADLKSRLAATSISRDARAALAPAAREAEHVSCVADAANPPMAASARARHSGAMALEACSAIFHGLACLGALKALAREAFRKLVVPADLLRHEAPPIAAVARPRRERNGTVGAHGVRVMRKDVGGFRPDGAA